jgi:hypothetical protein
VILFVACVLSAIFARSVAGCEQCFNRGSFDPAGNYLTTAKCWSGYSTGYATCIPTGSTCDTSNDSTCTAGGAEPVHPNSVPAELRTAEDCGTDLAGRCSEQTKPAKWVR